jgi:hypothetical protein
MQARRLVDALGAAVTASRVEQNTPLEAATPPPPSRTERESGRREPPVDNDAPHRSPTNAAQTLRRRTLNWVNEADSVQVNTVGGARGGVRGKK